MEMQRDAIKNTLAAIAISMAVGLAGCGGGGGDDDSTTTATFDGDTSGKVAKGIVINGAVTAEELDSNGNVLRQVGSATTDASGDYNLDIGDAYAGGVIRLTLSADGTSTQMLCDVQPDCGGVLFGSTMFLPASYSMMALLPVVQDGDSVSAQITPLTHMAASRVPVLGAYTADNVKLATSEISQMVGLDVLNVSPVDITDATAVDTSSDSELVYSAFTAGLGALMFEATDLTAGLQALADSFADGLFDGTDAISIISIIESVAEQASASGIDSLVLDQVLATIEADLQDLDGDGEVDDYNPEPTDAALLSDVEQAKALVSEIRTLASSIQELESPASVFKADLDLTSTVVNNNTQALMEFVGLVVEAINVKTTELALSDALVLDTEFIAEIYDGGISIGQVTFTLSVSDTGGLVISLTVDNVSGVDMDLTLVSNLPAADIIAGQAFTLSEVTLAVTGSVANSETAIGFNDMDLTMTQDGSIPLIPEPINPLNLTGDSLPTGLSFNGNVSITDLATGASFTGATTIELIELSVDSADDPTDPNPLSLSEVTLNGVFADTNDSFSADLGLTVNNAASFDTIAFLEHESWLWIYDSKAWDVFGFEAYASANGVTLIWGSYDPWSDQTCAQTVEMGYICVPGDVLLTQDYFANDLFSDAIYVGDFYVFYDASSSTTWYSGYVEFGDFETADNYVEATLTATLDLVLDGYPDTTAVVTVDRTDLDGGSAILTLIHDGNSITFNTVKVDGDDASGVDPFLDTVTVTNPDGASILVTAATDTLPISGDLSVDGVNVGTLYEVDGVLLIRYVDGSFETLY